MSNPESFNNGQKSDLEKKTERWQSKMAELTIPDRYGYVIDEKVRETIAALQLLGINTVQSDEGHHADYPWIEFEATYPKNVYVGEEELKNQLMTRQGITSEEINEQSSEFDRAKQVNIEEGARDRLVKSAAKYTTEFEDWHIKTLELVERLQGMINDFYSVQPTSDKSKILIHFPYRSPKYRERIQNIPFLEARNKKDEIENLTEEDHRKVLLLNQQEMERFTQYLKEQFFSEK